MAGSVRHAFGRREGEAAVRSHHERLELVLGTQPRPAVGVGGGKATVGAVLQHRGLVVGCAERFEGDVEVALAEVGEGADDEWLEPLLEPLSDELRAGADDQRVAVQAQPLGRGEPCLVVGVGDVLTKRAAGGVPESGRIVGQGVAPMAAEGRSGVLPTAIQNCG